VWQKPGAESTINIGLVLKWLEVTIFFERLSGDGLGL
jgi:hypothetical protein